MSRKQLYHTARSTAAKDMARDGIRWFDVFYKTPAWMNKEVGLTGVNKSADARLRRENAKNKELIIRKARKKINKTMRTINKTIMEARKIEKEMYFDTQTEAHTQKEMLSEVQRLYKALIELKIALKYKPKLSLTLFFEDLKIHRSAAEFLRDNRVVNLMHNNGELTSLIWNDEITVNRHLAKDLYLEIRKVSEQQEEKVNENDQIEAVNEISKEERMETGFLPEYKGTSPEPEKTIGQIHQFKNIMERHRMRYETNLGKAYEKAIGEAGFKASKDGKQLKKILFTDFEEHRRSFEKRTKTRILKESKKQIKEKIVFCFFGLIKIKTKYIY